VGAISCGTGAGRRGFRPSDLATAEELATRTAVALDRISLHRQVLAGQEHLQALVEAAPLAVLEYGTDGTLRQANTAGRELLGLTVHPDTEGVLAQFVADTAAGAPVAGAEAQARRADGTEVFLALYGAPLRDRAGNLEGVLVLAADVTARRNLEAQLVRARRIEAVGQVAGGVAHDFNNLLTVVLGHATMLGVVLPDDHPGRADVEAITLAAERAAGITSQLLTISRGDLATTNVFDPRVRLGRLTDTLRSLLPSPVELVVDVDDGDGRVRMSAAQFDQAILNLAVNARDAMPGGGTLTVRVQETDGAVVVTVADTGAGMDPATAARCFEPFFTTKGGARGTGLGLATVQSVISGAGGEVGLSTEPGKGTVFSLRLPRVAAADGPPSPGPEALPAIRAAGPTGERILVVENEDGLRRLAVEVLRAAGYVVTPAADGAAALAAVASDVPDLVVSDVVMPRMGGVELARRLGEDHPDVPVLFMTGYLDQASRESLRGGADVLIKPFTVEDLVTRVGDLLARRHAAQGSKR
jgi:two-component system cell cycle sensor histidine kinase/response regulator CckA